MWTNSWLLEPIRWVLAVFAAYRMARMVSSDEGPYLPLWQDARQTGIFEQIRFHAGVYDYGQDGNPETNLARGLSCPFCTGVYLAALVLLLVWRPTWLGDLFLGWMGISGVQAFLETKSSDGTE